MARQRFLSAGIGERLLASKLQILSGAGGRRPSASLAVLTGGSAGPGSREAAGTRTAAGESEVLYATEPGAPEAADVQPAESLQAAQVQQQVVPPGQILRTAQPSCALQSSARSRARTVYLSERHLRDIEAIVEVWQQAQPRRWTRSAVLRRAVEYLRDSVEADTTRPALSPDIKSEEPCPTL